MFVIRQKSRAIVRQIHRLILYRNQSNISNDSTHSSSVTWASSDTNGLVKQLSTRIRAGGPITIADFMRESLLNPQYVIILLAELFF